MKREADAEGAEEARGAPTSTPTTRRPAGGARAGSRGGSVRGRNEKRFGVREPPADARAPRPAKTASARRLGGPEDLLPGDATLDAGSASPRRARRSSGDEATASRSPRSRRVGRAGGRQRPRPARLSRPLRRGRRPRAGGARRRRPGKERQRSLGVGELEKPRQR